MYERAKPPSAGEFRRLQDAGLNRIALARAVELGMSSKGSAAPEWFIKRKKAGRTASVEAEGELLLTVWSVRGILPEAARTKFDQELSSQATTINPVDRNALVRIAGAILTR